VPQTETSTTQLSAAWHLNKQNYSAISPVLLQNSNSATVAFSAVTLSLRRQEEHLACKSFTDEVLVWLSVWSEVQILCIQSS